MATRQVTTGRFIYFNFLEEQGFQIGEWIKKQGWQQFCTLDIPIYPNLVREFFEHLRLGNSQIISTVKGIEVVLDEGRICKLLGMANQGICHLNLDKRFEGLQILLERKNVDYEGDLTAKYLSPEMRLLHNMVGRIFFPKTGRFDWVTEKDIAFIYHLAKEHPINLPFLMMSQIREAARKMRACLPYGMLFTLLFEKFGVDWSGEDSKKLLHTDRYTEKSLHRMGIQKVEGRWVRKVSGQHVTHSDSDSEDFDIPAAESSDSSSSDDGAEVGASAEIGGPQVAEVEHHVGAVPEFPDPDAGPSSAAPTSPRTPPTASTHVPPAPTGPSFSTQDFLRLSDTLVTRIESAVATQLTGLSHRMTQIEQRVTQSYDQLRGDLRELTLRVEVVERRDLSQGISADVITGLRSDFQSFLERLTEQTDRTYQGISRLESEFGAVLIATTGARSSFGASSSQGPMPPPQTTPRPSPVRPPFSATVRRGTGFPPPPQIGPASRTRTARGPRPFRSTRVQAPHTVDMTGDDGSSPDSDE